MYKLYLKWGNADAYYHTAFVQGVLLASSINFLLAILYGYTGNSMFKFSLFPLGVILALVVGLVVFYFHKNKPRFIDSDKRLSKKLAADDWIAIMIMLLMFSTWFITPFLYKWGAN